MSNLIHESISIMTLKMFMDNVFHTVLRLDHQIEKLFENLSKASYNVGWTVMLYFY